ncbi:MAG: MmcB family DNA repair protein [Pseudomonadota bacterium]
MFEDPPQLSPGRLLARGVSRCLRELDFACAEEFIPASGFRVDVAALGKKGEVWIVECKSSRADFSSDSKWEGYLPFCDRFFWAVGAEFPTEILPKGTGLIIADPYGAEILTMPEEQRLSGARRSALTRRLARHAAFRDQSFRDPSFMPAF